VSVKAGNPKSDPLKTALTVSFTSCALISLIYLISPSLKSGDIRSSNNHSHRFSSTFTGFISTDKGKNSLPFVVNNSTKVIYYKPESTKYNPGLDPNGIYPILPGEKLYNPVDGILTSAVYPGHVYKIPTGGSVIIDKDGRPSPTNLVGKLGVLLSFGFYGDVKPPDPNFARLAHMYDIANSH
jgi:hypothetical protein